MAHLTCVGATVAELRAVIGRTPTRARNVLACAATRRAGREPPGARTPAGSSTPTSSSGWCARSATSPSAWPPSRRATRSRRPRPGRARAAAKQEAGAEFAITQFFFRIEDYVSLVERARAVGVTIPIVPGVMPVTNVSQIERFAVLSGAAFPADLAELPRVGDDPGGARDRRGGRQRAVRGSCSTPVRRACTSTR
jgi:methylenetetrahydrofolate reductase (NADPH)